ncbi:hypothetical protein [Aquipuribacter sp. SD81]|uniref:hypothetical protein n=1 Tax=Aquipuribacter sp. SD81 TaxID=3127703 RepID=UPI00301A29B1
MQPSHGEPAPAGSTAQADLDELTAAVARLEGTADALDARLDGRPGARAFIPGAGAARA